MAGEADRAGRLAEALRANLRRRKAARSPAETAPSLTPEPAARDPSPRDDPQDKAQREPRSR